MKIKGMILVFEPKLITAEDLNKTIQRTRMAGRTPIVVLGQEGDDLLSQSRELDNCELVFSNEAEKGLFSRMKAGLGAAGTCALVVRVCGEYPRESEIKALESRHVQLDYQHKIYFIGIKEKKFPFLITNAGIKFCKELSADSNLEDVLKSSIELLDPI